MTDHYWRCRPENKEEAEKWPIPGSRGVPEQKKLDLEIPSGELALADLLVKHCGWEWYGGVKHSLIKDFGFAIHVTKRGNREGFRDLNALRQVWKELDELMLWGKFIEKHAETAPIKRPMDDLAWWAWWFFNNTESQVEAVIKVLREHFE